MLDGGAWKRLDRSLKSTDEDRWLSSRYCNAKARKALIALYNFDSELASIRSKVNEPDLGAIRFQWWRDALTGDPQSQKVETVKALLTCQEDAAYSSKSLLRMIDQHEDAFCDSQTNSPPAALVAALSAKVLAPAHGWSKPMREIAEHYDALKRGLEKGPGSVLPVVPSGIRPAVAHFRLRWAMANKTSPKPLAKRWTIFRAIATGRV